jgi:group I intron endonuclease
MIGIYKITSPSNRIYIGQSIRLEERLLEYTKQKNCDRQPKLFNSFIKYGIENHKIEILEECTILDLNCRERYWQDFYSVIINGLNCILTKTTDKKSVFSISVREKMSIARKGKKQSDEHINKRVNSKKGYIHSDETKNKISLKRSKILLDLNTGIFYDSILIASKTFNINLSTLKGMLSGRFKNKTNLIYA